MLERSVLRIGGGAAMVGAVLGLVFNLLHPRSGDAVGSVRGELELVADSGIWLFDHFMLAWALVFMFVGFVAIGWSYADDRAAGWGRFATASAIVAIVVGFVTLAVDGMAVKAVADDLARNPDDPSALATARPVAEISLALFTTTIGTLAGLTPVLFGIAGLVSDQYPRWLGWLILVSGLLGFTVASIQFLAGPSQFVTNVLFPIASIAGVVWLFLMGWQLWQGTEVTRPTQRQTASV